VTARYAIRCGTCRTAAALVGQTLSVLSSEVTDFMAGHEHVHRDFAIVEALGFVDCDEKCLKQAG
jgi:hypothetical protein